MSGNQDIKLTTIVFLQAAMEQILKELDYGDLFNIVTFESYTHAWSNKLMVANRNNIDQATQFVIQL